VDAERRHRRVVAVLRARRESDITYHRLVRDFLEGMCARVERQLYCSMAERFTAYMHERTRLRWLPSGRLRAGRPARIRFTMSKVSEVDLTVRRGGRIVAFVDGGLLGRGVHELVYTPPRRGTIELELEAKDYISHYTRLRKTVDVGR
jgi:hypothetical protein